MGFDEEKIKTHSRKVAIVEVDVPLAMVNRYFINYSAGIWHINLSPNLGTDGYTITGDDGLDGYFESMVDFEIFRIGSIRVDTVSYTEVASVSACALQNESFYYDLDNYMLYVHFDDFTIPQGKSITIGIILGFTNNLFYNGAYDDDIYYGPRLHSVPSIKKAKGFLHNSVLRFEGGSISLNNEDAYFEELIKAHSLFGQAVRIKYAINELTSTDWKQVFEGIVDDYSHDYKKFNLKVIDKRRMLSRKIPFETFSTTDYSDIDEDLIGQVKPLAWGRIRNAPIVCVNSGSTTPSTYAFFTADMTYEDVLTVSDVYVDGTILNVGKWSHSTSDGIVHISTDASTTTIGGDDVIVADSLDSITANYTAGSTKYLGLDLITNTLRDYSDISTSPIVDNYDSTEWATAYANSREICYHLAEPQEITKLLTDVSVAEDGNFIVLDDGRYTFRSTTGTSVKTIKVDEWLTEPKAAYKRSEFLTSVKIKFNKDMAEGEYIDYNNFEYESTAFEIYGVYEQKEFNTILKSSGDAATKSETIMKISKDIVPTISRKTKIQNIDLEVMDTIITHHTRPSIEEKEWAKWQIIGISKDLNKNEIDLTMRYLEDYDYVEDEDNVLIDQDYNYIGDSELNYIEVIG